MPSSMGVEQMSIVLRTSDPSANAAEVAAKNDRVGIVGIESPDVGVGGVLPLPAARSRASITDDHKNML